MQRKRTRIKSSTDSICAHTLGAVLFQVQPLYRGSLRQTLLRLKQSQQVRRDAGSLITASRRRLVPFVPFAGELAQPFRNNGSRCQQASPVLQVIDSLRGVHVPLSESLLGRKIYQSAPEL